MAALPLALSLGALLDIARRPEWAWALAQRRRIVWMAAVMIGVLSVVGGMVISLWYLLLVRPDVARAERGEVDLQP